MDIKNKVLWGIITIELFIVSYWLSRFFFFEMHGMKQWPNLLAIVGLIIVVVSNILERRILSVATIAGYMGGFALAMIFNTDGIDSGGGATNNAWIIWGCAFVLSVIVGLFIENDSKVVGFVSMFIVLCGLILSLFIQIFKQYTTVTILVPIIIILGVVFYYIIKRKRGKY